MNDLPSDPSGPSSSDSGDASEGPRMRRPQSGGRPMVVVEVEERPSPQGCTETDRRWFRRGIRRLEEEFGAQIEVRWEPAETTACTRPVIWLNGERLYEGGFLPWETLRPAVARALALELAVLQDHLEARDVLRRYGLEAEDWQDGLLTWIHRLEDDSERG
ncbi:MAG: hypothetical protein Kow00129_02520 [Thermoleophilia bacterium]